MPNIFVQNGMLMGGLTKVKISTSPRHINAPKFSKTLTARYIRNTQLHVDFDHSIIQDFVIKMITSKVTHRLPFITTLSLTFCNKCDVMSSLTCHWINMVYPVRNDVCGAKVKEIFGCHKSIEVFESMKIPFIFQLFN